MTTGWQRSEGQGENCRQGRNEWERPVGEKEIKTDSRKKKERKKMKSRIDVKRRISARSGMSEWKGSADDHPAVGETW